MRLQFVHILLLLFLPFSTIHSQEKKIALDPAFHLLIFQATGQDSVFNLPHRFLLDETVHIRADSLPLEKGIAYLVHTRKGQIEFILPPDSGSSLFISYKYLPIQLLPEYFHWQLSDSLQVSKTKQQPDSDSKQSPVPSRDLSSGSLNKSGSIFRGISVGTNQGMRLQSGLRLQVSGKITPKVDITASLTDQSTPIQPEGNTQSLQEIDKVFVNIKAPGLQVTMGDFNYDVKGSEFGSYSRKLQGATGTAETSWGSLRLIAAASKGNFTTNHFQGEEGKQGPYQLTGSLGQREIIVLAGTERVWIDGDRLIRGEENDYTIEYGNGQITFTRKKLITGDSRITVDFEYSDQKFQKEIYGAVADGRFLKDRLKIHTSFFRESDDKENPLDVVLTEEHKNVLERAGDDPDSAVVSGATYVGENLGSYQRVDTLDVVTYLYVGSNKGDYKIRFSYVGTGKGDYSFQGYGIYRYDGPGQGSYLPIIYLPLAASHQVVNLASSFEMAKGVSIEGEVGISDRDLNRYSTLDDGDNVDFAYWSRFRIDSLNLRLFGKGLGQMGLFGNIRSVGDKFRSLGRMTEIEHGRKWGVEEGSYWGEDVQELTGFYMPIPNWKWEGQLGYFKKGDGFQSRRKKLVTQLNQPKVPRMHYQVELIETTDKLGEKGYWLRQQGNVGVELKWFKPSIHYMGEHRKNEMPDTVKTGFRFDELASSMIIETGSLKGEWREIIRDDRIYILDNLQKNSLARTDQFKLDLKMGKNMTTSFMYTHRDRNYTDENIEDQKSDLADVKIKLFSGKRFFDGSVNYRFSSTQVSQMVKDTINVGEGLGNYRFDEDLNELVPDSDGDILLRTIQTGEFLPVNDLRMGSEIRLNGSRLWKNKTGILGFLGNLHSRSLIRVERRDKERSFSAVNLSAFQPDWGNDTTTVMGLISFHQDVEYKPSKSKFSMRVRFRNDDSENHQLVQEGLVRTLRERSIRVKGNPLKRLGLLVEYKHNRDNKIYTASHLSNRNIQSDGCIAEVSYRPKQKIEFALKARAAWSRDIFPDPVTEATSVFIIPRFGYSFKGRGHLRAELEFGEVHSSPSDRTLPYEMLKGDQPGRTFRWTILMTYRISGHVMATFNYRGRQEPWRKRLYQTGQVEIRAFF